MHEMKIAVARILRRLMFNFKSYTLVSIYDMLVRFKWSFCIIYNITNKKFSITQCVYCVVV